MPEPELGGILGILRFLKDARSVVKEADSFLDDAENIVSKHKNAIAEVFGEFLPEIGSRVDTLQTVKTGEIKPAEEVLVDVFAEGNTINVIASTFANQPEVELSEDNQSITIHYDENKTKPIQLPCAIEYKDKYLFEWNNDSKRVITALKKEFNIEWLTESALMKITDKIMYIFDKEKDKKLSILIEEAKATLRLNNENIFDLKIKIENGKTYVYRDSYTFRNGVLNLLFTKKDKKMEEKKELVKW